MKAFSNILAAAAVIFPATAGLAQGQMQAPGSMPSMSGQMDPAAMRQMMKDMMPSTSDSASTKDFKEGQMSMMKNMHVPYTGNPDVDFRAHMIPHHQGAIAMAKIALGHAKDADTKKLAQKIIDDQEREIGEMRAWLKQHGAN